MNENLSQAQLLERGVAISREFIHKKFGYELKAAGSDNLSYLHLKISPHEYLTLAPDLDFEKVHHFYREALVIKDAQKPIAAFLGNAKANREVLLVNLDPKDDIVFWMNLNGRDYWEVKNSHQSPGKANNHTHPTINFLKHPLEEYINLVVKPKTGRTHYLFSLNLPLRRVVNS